MSFLDRIEPYVSRFGTWATAIGSVWAFMIWAASNFAPLSGYGWGTYVFAGLAAVCVLLLCLSIALVSWRFLHPIARTDPKPETKPKEIARSADPEDSHDVLHLLHFGVDYTTYLMLDHLIRLAEHPSVVDAIKAKHDSAQADEARRFYLSRIRDKIVGDWRRNQFESVMNEAEREAEHNLEVTPLNERPTDVDHLALRKYLILQQQFLRAQQFLHREKQNVENRLLLQRDNLIQRLRRHDKSAGF